MTELFNIRVAQLDLARQMENLDYIKSFIDFIADCGYNALGLYLEGRIRTHSFPYPSANESYSVAEMKEIVEYAGTKEIDVIPVIGLFGHAELFLKYKEMEYIAELRDGKSGRFSDVKSVFCPSLPETYQFFDKYLSEIIEIFPSDYFNVGCDEAWNIGICDLCHNLPGSHTDIFVKHLNELHKLVSGKFTKKMIIWDDLFENYSMALDEIPKDIILAVWQYESVIELPLAHMGNRRRIDKLALYDQKGFNYFICPAVNIYRNAATFTKYAIKHKPLGAWLTAWELEQAFLHRSYPVIAFVGKLWTGEYTDNYEELFKATLSEIFSSNDAVFIENLKAIYNFDLPRLVRNDFNLGPITEEELIKRSFMELLSVSLQKYYPAITAPFTQDILESILIGLEIELQTSKTREIVPKLMNPEVSETVKRELIEKDLSMVLDKFSIIRERRCREWEKHRTGILPCNSERYFTKVIDSIAKFKEIKNTGVLNVYFCLPEYYSVQKISFHVKYQDDADWELVASGVYKQYPLFNPFYVRSFEVSEEKVPEAVRIQTSGYGGQGMTYLEIKNNLGTFSPNALSGLKGRIENPAYILDNDDKWCFLGEKDTRREFLEPKLADLVHSMDIHLKTATSKSNQ